ncbi:TIGR02302 family protein [Sulfitobacter donghicola]|uniref:ATPase n=1 Tax=Sulfitobacter donghicola DSW-25 = KCTC 12864 = JCM 14565 TaxID=1300350 RepID=A0A073IWH1_9RHOB|nr:TIGR02302 family protein [Sulfitobacter donghicola]KEJ89727.1 ATPase [Sulfitobacter donghicola DSW-25 = KCTC 12864 = JCM 14565]KIN67177.1 DUF4175 domain containing protein [Sulfitobacter donghicola DSW-25 = KCTC 12864 = JCM 14565]
MVQFTPDDLRRTLAGLRWPLRLTRLGMFAEVAAQSLWPLMAVILFALAAAMLGLHEVVPIEVLWGAVGLATAAGIWAVVYAYRHWAWPTKPQAMARLDSSLKGRPLTALLDDQAIGEQDAASAAVWRAHKRRMAERVKEAKSVPADLRVSSRDPYAFRLVAVLAFAVALLFGSIWRVGTVAQMASGGTGAAISGPVWEGWAEPPRYSGKPTLYLNDQDAGEIELPIGTLITMRLYGEVGALEVSETVSGNTAQADPEAPAKMAFDFKVSKNGVISVDGPDARHWNVTVRQDAAPEVVILGKPEVSVLGEMRLPFAAKDDYGVEAGEARILLDLASVDRRYGLVTDPDPQPEIIVPLPMPIAGNRVAFEENLIDDFSQHPWANLPVTVSMKVLDAAEQEAQTAPTQMTLPGRRFFDPTAAALIEMRRDFLWSRSNARRSGQILRAVSYLPQQAFRSETTALRLRKLIDRLEMLARFGINDENQSKLAQDMWNLAIELEEGDLEDARERMRRAQERLNEAMKNGASDEEIAELMQELRRATEEYMQQLQREQAQRQDQQEGGEQQQGESMQMTQDDLQRMMDRIQELMEQGRMAEAEQALKEFQEMMENMQVTEGQQGEGGQSPGEQAMEGLADTLREQQGLSDQAFRDLQEQFNPNAQAGENQGNEGRNGGQGRGQSHEGQQGEGEGEQNSQNGEEGGGGQQGQGNQEGQGQEQSLAQRQQQLRDELNRQEGRMPGQGTPEGDAARDALGRAGDAMDEAEQNLRDGDLAEAIDNQSQAMEALRDSMRSLGEAIAEEQRNQQQGQGGQQSDRRADNRDPLGRDQGSNGATGSDSEANLDDDAHNRARELYDEIRRHSEEATRPKLERDYLNRLLDRF